MVTKSSIRSSGRGVRDLSNRGIFCPRHLAAGWSLFSQPHHRGSDFLCPESDCQSVACKCEACVTPVCRRFLLQWRLPSLSTGGPGLSWQLPACSHHGCCRHHHIQADALVTVILLLMEVIGTSSCHIKGQKLFPNRRHRATWHPSLPLLVTTLPAMMPAATVASLAQRVWQSPSNLWKQLLREASPGHSKCLCALKSVHHSPASLFLICFWRCKQHEN